MAPSMLALALTLAAVGAPPLEGWWRPEGPDPHPSAMTEAVRARVAAALVSFGGGRSGTFVSKDGLILTSASAIADCARRLRAEGRIGPSSFIAPLEADAPLCPDLKVRVRLDSRDVRGAVEAARRAGSTEVEAALLGACRRLGADRRCALLSTEDGAQRLLVHRELSRVRLRFFPGEALGGLGGPARSFTPPWLRLDAALVSVSLGRAGVPGELRLAPRPPAEVGQELWVAQHPQPNLRWASALETIRFVEDVLPAYRARAARVGPRGARARALLDGLAGLGEAAIRDARRRELDALERLRGLQPPARARRLQSAFTDGRDAAAGAPLDRHAAAGTETPRPPLFEHLARALPVETGESPPPLTPAARAFLDAAAIRNEAFQAASRGTVGPGARGDLRVARGRVARATGELGWRVPWGRLLGAAERSKVDLPLPEPLPWSAALAVGFELRVDLGPTVTGAPVLDADGRIVGVVSGGDAETLGGFFRFRPDARVGVGSAHALEQALARAFDARALAAELRR